MKDNENNEREWELMKENAKEWERMMKSERELERRIMCIYIYIYVYIVIIIIIIDIYIYIYTYIYIIEEWERMRKTPGASSRRATRPSRSPAKENRINIRNTEMLRK